MVGSFTCCARIQRPRRGAPKQTYELSPVHLIESPLAKEPPQHSGSRGSSQGLLHREISIRPMSGVNFCREHMQQRACTELGIIQSPHLLAQATLLAR